MARNLFVDRIQTIDGGLATEIEKKGFNLTVSMIE